MTTDEKIKLIEALNETLRITVDYSKIPGAATYGCTPSEVGKKIMEIVDKEKQQ